MCDIFVSSHISYIYLFEDKGSSIQSPLPSIEHIRRAAVSRGMPPAHLVKSHSSHRAPVSLPVGAFASVDLAPMKSEYMRETQRQWLGLSTPEKMLSTDTDCEL